MTARQRLLSALRCQPVGRSYARQFLAISGTRYTQLVAELRALGDIEIAGVRGNAWEWRLTETGKEQAK